jgi:hypothetical protein
LLQVVEAQVVVHLVQVVEVLAVQEIFQVYLQVVTI